jgi:hypothetical protein
MTSDMNCGRQRCGAFGPHIGCDRASPATSVLPERAKFTVPGSHSSKSADHAICELQLVAVGGARPDQSRFELQDTRVRPRHFF